MPVRSTITIELNLVHTWKEALLEMQRLAKLLNVGVHTEQNATTIYMLPEGLGYARGESEDFVRSQWEALCQSR